MKRVYTFNLGESAEAGLIKNLMGKDGIPCLIRWLQGVSHLRNAIRNFGF